jgi:hypothetical protein
MASSRISATSSSASDITKGDRFGGDGERANDRFRKV